VATGGGVVLRDKLKLRPHTQGFRHLSRCPLFFALSAFLTARLVTPKAFAICVVLTPLFAASRQIEARFFADSRWGE
jgi:hypothetical protein